MREKYMLYKISRLRRILANLVVINGSLTNSRVVAASQELDSALNDYYRLQLMKQKMKKSS